MNLPDGYYLELDPDLPRLFAPNGAVVAHFGLGYDPREVEKAAAEHLEKVNEAIREAERLLGREGDGGL
jgi:hypothetical protein